MNNYKVTFGVYNSKGRRRKVAWYVGVQGDTTDARWAALSFMADAYQTGEKRRLVVTRVDVESVEVDDL